MSDANNARFVSRLEIRNGFWSGARLDDRRIGLK